MKIRLATVDDIPALHRIVNAAYRPVGVHGWTHENALLEGARISESQLAESLSQLDTALLVGENAQQALVATVFLERKGDAVYIGMLSVAPHLQAQGLGKAMLEAAEQYAATHWHPQRFLMWVLSTRTELIAFYLRRGYGLTGKVLDFPLAANVGIPKVADLTLEGLQKLCVSSPWRPGAATAAP